MSASQLPSDHRSTPQRALTLLFSCILLLGCLFAGRTYSWCLLTGQVCTIACLEDGGDDAHEDGPALHEQCCEPRALAGLPLGAHRDGLPGVPDPRVAVLPVLPPPGLPSARRSHRTPLLGHALQQAAAPRAGPRCSGERCAVLQVFRC